MLWYNLQHTPTPPTGQGLRGVPRWLCFLFFIDFIFFIASLHLCCCDWTLVKPLRFNVLFCSKWTLWIPDLNRLKTLKTLTWLVWMQRDYDRGDWDQQLQLLHWGGGWSETHRCRFLHGWNNPCLWEFVKRCSWGNVLKRLWSFDKSEKGRFVSNSVQFSLTEPRLLLWRRFSVRRPQTKSAASPGGLELKGGITCPNGGLGDRKWLVGDSQVFISIFSFCCLEQNWFYIRSSRL